MRSLCCLLFVAVAATPAEWGPVSAGLRLSLQIEGEYTVVTFQNVQDRREMFLPLGRIVGVAEAEFLRLFLTKADGSRHALTYTGGNGVAPGRLIPYIVPMMGGSIYTVRTPLLRWRLGKDLVRIESDLHAGGKLQAQIASSPNLESQYIDCYGLRMFWSGVAVSNFASNTAR